MRPTKGEDRLFDACNHAALSLVLIVVLYPLIYLVSASFSDPALVYNGTMWLLPKGFTTDGYRRVLEYRELWVGYGNTVYYTVGGTLLNLSVTLPCAYALSRRDLKGRTFILTLFMITLYVGGGLIPEYLNLRDLNLLNTRFLMLISGLVSTHNLIVSRTFFASIPVELQESATLDGCTNFGVFLRVVLPLSQAIVAVMALYYGLTHWNSYFNAMIGLRNRALYPLQLYLREILVESQISATVLETADLDSAAALMEKQKVANLVKYVVIIVSSAPLLAIYPFLQRFFIKGVMIGSVKG
jgi:putative aldouronate transport system permease protein